MQYITVFYFLIASIVFARFLFTVNDVEQPTSLEDKDESINFCFSLLLALFFVFVVSGRSFYHMGDTQTYLTVYRNIGFYSFSEIGEHFRVEYGFLILTKLINFFGFSERGYLVTVSIIQMALWYICLNRYLSNTKVLLALFFFISFFVTYNAGANVLRQGISIPIAFIAGSFFIKRSYLTSLVLFYVATIFHTTSLIVLLSFIVAFRSVAIRYYFYTFLLLTILSYLNVFSDFIIMIPGVNESYSHILNATERYDVGFRFGFWAFTIVPLILYFFLTKAGKKENDLLFKIYLTFSSIFTIAFAIPYSDRFGLYAWMFMIVLIPKSLGSYRFNIFNDYRLFLIVVAILGAGLFIFFPLMQLTYKFSEIF